VASVNEWRFPIAEILELRLREPYPNMGIWIPSDLEGAEAHLFPPIEPYVTGRLTLDAPHEMYWEECGTPNGVPIVFLHGGPGGGAGPKPRRFFDPGAWRVVVFDQRGAGRSTPLGELKDNTTQHLIADIERLRASRGIDRWAVFGGSWGSTLALAYAEAHPERCLGLILRGIFLGERCEIEWFMSGLRLFSPGPWREFADAAGPGDPAGLLERYRALMADPDPAISLAAARAWAVYEARSSALLPSPAQEAEAMSEGKARAVAPIEAHYFAHDCFLAPGQLIRGVERIRSLPGTIVQGRYDLLCPPRVAERLHEAWPEAEYVLVPDAGHIAFEPSIARELVAATERLRSRLKK
jgi:proline iminopeptidase